MEYLTRTCTLARIQFIENCLLSILNSQFNCNPAFFVKNVSFRVLRTNAIVRLVQFR
jgi:hypothetical protein